MSEDAERVVVGLIQMKCGPDGTDNLQTAVENITSAAKGGAQIVCTQELFKSRYFPQVQDPARYSLAEPVGPESPGVRPLRDLAARLKIVLIASLFEKRAPGLYHNTSVVIDADGTFLGKYRKMHIPDDPLYYEKYYFTPGDLGYPVFRTRYADLSVLICWDQWYPEAARLAAMGGARIIFYPTAIGYSRPGVTPDGIMGHDSWQTVMRGHAVANACFVAAINRVGFEPNPAGEGGITFWGGSFIANPNGKVIARASDSEAQTVVQQVDLSLVDKVRAEAAYFFRDRRVDSYEHLLARAVE
jgi:N-carbamoylputrescine amidase